MTRPARSSPVVLFTGPTFSGKSLSIELTARQMTVEGMKAAGFVQRGVFDKEGRKTGYDLVRLTDGRTRLLARRREDGRGWSFREDAFVFAHEAVMGEGDACFVDEIGPMELQGRGHGAALAAALEANRLVVITVREGLVEEIRRRMPSGREILMLHHRPDRAPAPVKAILSMLSRQHG